MIYQRLAEIAGEYLKKGSKVYIEGRLRTRKWQDNQGVERYTTEIIANDLQMLDGVSNSGVPQPQAGQSRQATAQQPAKHQGQYYSGYQKSTGHNQRPAALATGGPMAPPIDFDDDIPALPFAPIGLHCI